MLVNAGADADVDVVVGVDVQDASSVKRTRPGQAPPCTMTVPVFKAPCVTQHARAKGSATTTPAVITNS